MYRGPPSYGAALISGKPGLDFSGAGLWKPGIPLTTDVTVFVVMQHRSLGNRGAIAHHGNRDVDWSLEQNGLSGIANIHR